MPAPKSTRLFLALATVGALTLLCDRVGGDRWLGGVLVAHLPPAGAVALAGCVTLSGLFAATYQRGVVARIVTVVAALLLFPALALPLTKWRFGGHRASGGDLRVVTYNVEKWSFTGAEVAEAIAPTKMDVLCLPEADHYWWQAENARTPEAFVRALSDRSQTPYRLLGTREVRIVTRLPVRKVEEISLDPGPSSRPMVVATLDAGRLGEVTVVAVHLVPTLALVNYSGDRGDAAAGGIADVAEVRRAQAQKLAAEVARRKGPVVVCGDLNAAETWMPLKILEAAPANGGKPLLDAWTAVGSGAGVTAPTGNPRIRIDYLLVRALVPRGIDVLENVWTSDHHPVVGDFAAE